MLNRAAFEQDIKKAAQKGVSSVLFIDIDNFRDFNNKFGHMAGDSVLQKVSKTIKECVRTNDRVYRYGGEEIVVLLIECGKENAERLAEKIRVTINGLDNTAYPKISVSIGIATYPDDSDDIFAVVEKSDSALLAAKSKGKNRIEISK
ncbi:MAG: GGDEF domain-containing protein [Peptococcaceae bacterium]|nr:GGDEF domain-containing protein [Peptococcaceae bacterium]